MNTQLLTQDARERLLATLPVTERRLQLARMSTPVLEGGDGPAVVLLHGPGGNAAHWMRVIPDLVATHRVIVPDLPGHGASGAIQGALDDDRVLEWLGELIERTCESPPALVGQLLGGAIALRFAAAHGKRLGRLVLVDTFGLSPFQPAPQFGRALNDFLAQPDERTHEKLWRHCAFDLDGLRERMGGDWEPFEAYNLDRARSPEVKAALVALMERFGAPAIPPEDLGRIGVPTTLIWGRHDLATPLAVAEAASKRYGWPLHVIENANDDPPIEQPKSLLRALRTALGGSNRRNEGGTMARAKAGTTDTLQETRAAWDTLAAGYDEFVTPSHMWLAGEGLRRAGVRPGLRLLDVAAGSGALSISAARLGARVLSTDLSPVMLEHLQVRARKEGLDIETRVMDGHALEFEDDTFDVSASQFGVMLFPDMPRGIGELARVTKPGGLVLMNVYGAPRQIEFFGFFVDAIQAAVPGFTGPPMDPPPLPFQLQDPERLRGELVKAGLKDVRVETITEKLEFQSGEQLWDWLTNSNPIVGTVLGALRLKKEQIAVVRQALDERVHARAGGKGFAVLTNPINIGIGTKQGQ